MKLHPIVSLLAALCAAVAIHAEAVVAGPHGGRLLTAEPLQAEFFVTPARHVEITFFDAKLTPVAPGAQSVAVTAEPAAGRVKLDLEKTATGFLSKQPLPAGEPYRVVVQVRANPEAKPQNFRIDLNLANCGECHRAEYACICEGH